MPEHDWIQRLGTSRPSHLFPTSRRHYFIGAANTTHVWNHLHWLPSWQRGCHFPTAKQVCLHCLRQMHMPTATLPSSGEQSNPLLKKWLIQILASMLFFRWIKKRGKKMTWQIISGLLARTRLSVSDRITWWMVVIRQIGQQSRRDWVDLERGGRQKREKLRHSELLATVGRRWWLRTVCVNCKYRSEAAPNTLCEMWPFQRMFPSWRICPSHPQQRVDVRRRGAKRKKKMIESWKLTYAAISWQQAAVTWH